MKQLLIITGFFSQLVIVTGMAQFLYYKVTEESIPVEKACFNKIFVPDSLTHGML